MALPRLYLDENLSMAVAGILRGRKCDVQRVQDAGMIGRSDLDQLLFATQHHRCLVSQNIADFVALHTVFVRQDRSHAGIVLVAHDPRPSVVASKLLKRLARESAESLKSKLLFA